MKNKVVLGMLCAIGAETIYGTSYVFTKTATENASALTLLGWRFLVAFVIMTLLVLCGIIKLDYRGKNINKLIKIAIMFPGIYYVGETFGINLTTASESGTILACIPVMAVVASTIILKEKPYRMQLIGIGITLIGVIITVLAVSISLSFSVMGYFLLIVGVISYALYCVFVDEAPEFTGAEITYFMIAMGCIIYTQLAVIDGITSGTMGELITAPFHDTALLQAVLFQGIVCSIAAFFLSNMAIAKIGVNKTASFVGISTVVSIQEGIFILGEPFTLLQTIGAVIIVAGVIIANREKKE